MSEHILVLGASGRVGALVVAQLAAAGRNVTGLVRNPARVSERWPANAQVLRGDLSDPTSVAAAMQGISAMLIASPIHPQMAAWQCAAVQAAAAAGVARIVKLSGSAWTLTPGAQTTVGAAHAAVEAELETLASRGVECVSIRPNAFTQGMLGRVAADLADPADPAVGQPLSLAIGNARVSFTDVRDIASALAQALAGTVRLPQRLEVTGPVAVGGEELAATLTQLLGRPIRYRPIPIEQAIERAQAAGASTFILQHQREVLSRIAEGRAAAVEPSYEQHFKQPRRPPSVYLSESLA